MKNKIILFVSLILICLASINGFSYAIEPLLCTGKDANIACLAKNKINLSLSEPEANQKHYNGIFNKAYENAMMCKETVPFLNLWDYLKGNAEHAEIYYEFVVELCSNKFECCVDSMLQVSPQLRNEMFNSWSYVTSEENQKNFEKNMTNLTDKKYSSIRQEFLKYIQDNKK